MAFSSGSGKHRLPRYTVTNQLAISFQIYGSRPPLSVSIEPCSRDFLGTTAFCLPASQGMSKSSLDDGTVRHSDKKIPFLMWGWIWLPLITRISISLLTRTFFQPDEYFQSLEPAHRMVFGFGHLTWEWVSSHPVRSFSFPSLFVPLYYALKLLRLDNAIVLVRAACCTRLVVLSLVALQIWAPKVLTGIVASITDCSVYRLTYLLFGRDYATVAVRAQF
jgi:hypothetical protein